MDAVRAERAHHVHGEEGEPAHDEAADDDAQGLRRLRLHAKPLHLRNTTSRHAWSLIRALETPIDLISRELFHRRAAFAVVISTIQINSTLETHVVNVQS